MRLAQIPELGMVEERLQRRLAAILAADVVGYSRLMEENEADALARLRILRSEILNPRIEDFGGRIVKLMGDGTLVEFGSAVDAVHCAVSIQEEVARRNSDVNQEKPIELRIGVNLGDVVVEEHDIYGDGVNVAARLEALAEPGGVCISSAVYRIVRNTLDLEFVNLGQKEVKSIAEPIHVYSLRPRDTMVDRRSGQEPVEKSKVPAVAVLPFDNMSGDSEQEYFSDGLAEDLITALSQWHSIPVIARNSSFTYKGESVHVQRIAEELGARYILEGSVRRAGNRVRISAQLIDAGTGHHVWAEKFDRQLEDIFDVQDEITNRIAATIVPELEHFEQKKSVAKRTEDLNAWDHYVRGMEHFYRETCEDNAHARTMFQLAAEQDPNYSDAWARLGWVHARDVQLGCTTDPEDSLRKGFAAARKAVALDDSSALAHISLGSVHIWAEETELGLAEAQVALQLNSNFAHAAMAVGNRLDLVGQTEAGIAQMERSLQLNPRDPMRWRYMAYLARAYVSLEEYDTAAEWGQKAVSLRPESPDALFRQAICLAHLDRVEEARSLLDRCDAIEPGFIAQRAHWQPYSDLRRNEHLLAGLRRHGLLG
jgi:adenylate cyclase